VGFSSDLTGNGNLGGGGPQETTCFLDIPSPAASTASSSNQLQPQNQNSDPDPEAGSGSGPNSRLEFFFESYMQP
jgi:hypothetical protein